MLALGGAALVVLVLACSSGSSISSAATGANGSSKAPYTVQLIADISGVAAPTSTGPADGFQAVFDKVNSAGGVNGHKIKVTVNDDQSTTTGAQATAQAAVSANPTVIADASISTYILARQPIYQTGGLPVVATGAPDSMVNPTLPWLYSDQGSASQSADQYVGGLEEALGTKSLAGKKVAIEGLVSPAVDAIINPTSAMIKAAGGSVVSVQRLANGSTSFASQAADMVSAGATSAVVVDSAPDTVIVSQALITAGLKGPIISSDGAADDGTLQKINSPQFYADRTSQVPLPGDLMYQTAAKYGFKAGAAASFFAKGWAQAYVIVDTLTKCGFPCAPANFEKIADGLGTQSLVGNPLFGPVKITKTRHAELTGCQLFQWDTTTDKSKTFGTIITFTN
jgi:branched-chain amino acid transport system substrate-binding protein